MATLGKEKSYNYCALDVFYELIPSLKKYKTWRIHMRALRTVVSSVSVWFSNRGK